MKKTLILISVVIAVSGVLYAVGDTPQELTETQKAAIAEHERLKELKKKGKCPDTEILVDIDGYTLKVPRTMSFIYYKDGTWISGLKELPYRCDIKHIKDAQSITTGRFSVSSGNQKEPTSRETHLQKQLEKHNDTTKLLPDGIIEVGRKYYLLPLEKSRTADGKPVIFECTSPEEDWGAKQYSGGCDVGYIHPTGLRFGYRVTTGSWINNEKRLTSAQDFIEIDRQKRKRLEDMIVKRPNEGYGK